MNTKQFNNKRKTVEEVVVRRKIFSESAPDLASISRPETTDRIYDGRSKTLANGNHLASSLKPRSKTAADISLPSINARTSMNMKQSRKGDSYEDLVRREEENRELFENVVEYCKVLQERIKELELERLMAAESANSPQRVARNSSHIRNNVNGDSYMSSSSSTISPTSTSVSA